MPLIVGLVALLVATVGPVAGKDALGLGKSLASHDYVAAPPVSQRFAAERLSDFVIPADSQWPTTYRTANAVPSMINDGLGLLRQHISPGDTVVTLAYTDPFSFALSLSPPRGVLQWWDLNYNFDTDHYLDADRVFGGVTWVMIPRMQPGQGCCQERSQQQVMLDLYGPYLAQHYTESARTADWILLARA